MNTVFTSAIALVATASAVKISTSCTDNNSNCSYWASRDECQINPNYMLTQCAKSCKQCVVDPCIALNNNLGMY